jgi:hypothetical protein
MTNAGDLASLALRAKFTRGLLLAYMVLTLLAVPLGFVGGFMATRVATDPRLFVIAVGALSAIDLAIELGLVIAIPLWVYRARANLAVFGTAGLRYSPAWSALSFFVPIIGLFVPFLAMRQIYNRSMGENEYLVDASVPDVTSWWACYISGVLIAAFLLLTVVFNLNGAVFIVTPVFITLAISVFDTLLLIGAAFFLWRIVGSVTIAQQGFTGIVDSFLCISYGL